MNTMKFFAPEKSTIGRLFIKGMEQLLPRVTERHAAYAFGLPSSERSADPQSLGLPMHHFTTVLERTDRVRLAVWEWGLKGPTVLLVHGWNGQAAQMSRFVKPLVEAGFHVIAFDLPAHGRSTGSHANLLDLRDAVLTVGRLFAPLSAVIAHSLGATASALALDRGLPALRAVLLAPPAEVGPFATRFAERIGLSADRLPGVLDELRVELGDLRAFDLQTVAARLRTAALILHDPEDREVPFAHGLSVAAAWPGAQLERLERLGHRRLLADAELIGRVVGFVRGDQPTRQPRAARRFGIAP